MPDKQTKKKCTNCGKKKDIAAFYAHPRTADRLQSWCRECMKAAANKRCKRLVRERRSL